MSKALQILNPFSHSTFVSLIDNNAKDPLFTPGEMAVSGYFVGQLAGMLVSGWMARRTSEDNAQKSTNFQEELDKIRFEQGKEKNKSEIEFLRECHELGMRQMRETAIQSCKNRYKEEEFKQFCETIWATHFRPDIDAVLSEIGNLQGADSLGMPMTKIMIARTPLTCPSKDKKGSYADFCDSFRDDILIEYDFQFDPLWLRCWNQDCVSAMSDTMNLHYIMQGIPAIIVFPIQRGGFLSIETSTWGCKLGQNNMMMDKTFRVPMSAFEEDNNRLNLLIIAAAAYIDDCSRLIVQQSAADSIFRLPDAIRDDRLVKSLVLSKYKKIVEWAEDASSSSVFCDMSYINELKKALEQWS